MSKKCLKKLSGVHGTARSTVTNWQVGLPIDYLQGVGENLNRGPPRDKSKPVVREEI